MLRISLALIISLFTVELYAQDWVKAYQNSVAYYNNFQSEAALAEVVKAYDNYQSTVSNPDKNLGAILRQLSVVHYDLGNSNEAVKFGRQEVELLQTLGLDADMNFSNALQNLALIRMNRSEYAAAEPLLIKALQIVKLFNGLESYEVGIVKGNLAITLFQLEKDEAAGNLFEEAVMILNTYQEVGPEYYNIIYNYASLLATSAELEAALEYFLSVEDYYNYETPNYEYGSILIKVGDIYDQTGNFSMAVAKYSAAVENFEEMGIQNAADYNIALNNLALSMQKAGNYEEAILLMEKLVQQLEPSKSEQPIFYASAMANYGNLLIRSGDPDEAREVLMTALKFCNDSQLKEGLTYVNILESLGGINLANGNLSMARAQSEEAIGLAEMANYESKLYSLYQLKSRVLVKEGKYEEARNQVQRALDQATSHFGKAAIQTAYVRGTMADVLTQLGKYDEAEILYQEVIEVFSKSYGLEHPETAKVLGNYSSLLQLKGNYYAAETYLTRSLNIKKVVFGEANPDYLATNENLALLYQNTARYTEANQILENVLAKKQLIYSPDDPSIASTYLNLGAVRKQLADYPAAEKYFFNARNIYLNSLGANHIFYASALDNLALLYQKMGNTAAAKPLFKEALKIYESSLGKYNTDYATALENLATVYLLEDDLLEAKKLLEEVLTIDKQILGTQHPLYSKTLHNLASVYERNMEYEQARELYNQALAIDEQVFGINHPSYASTLYNLGVLQQELEQYDYAMQSFKQVVQIRKEVLGDEHPDYVFSLYGLAHILHRTGDFEGALPVFSQVIDQYLDQINEYFPALSESEKSAFYGKIRPVIESYMDFGVEFVLLGKGSLAERNELLGSLYDLQLATKALLLNASNKVRNRINSSGNAALIALFNSWISLKENIVKAYALSKEELEKSGISITQMEAEANQKEKQLSLKSSAFAAEFEKQQITWRQVQQKLNSEQSAIEIIRIKKKINKDSVQYVSLILNDVGYPKIHLNGNGINMESRGFKVYKNSIVYKVKDTKSFGMYWSDVNDLIPEQTKEIYLSADGVYNKINLSTLFDSERDEYVLDKYKIRLLSNTRELVASSDESNSQNHALLFGFPKYNLDAVEMASTTDLITDADTRYSFGDKVAELPGTLEEINNIENVLKSNQWSYTKYISVEATEDQIKRLQSPKILHIATHGFFLSDIKVTEEDAGLDSRSTKFNPLLRSGLLLAGAENTIRAEGVPGEEDGILTAYEAMNLNLDQTDLVVMSACETGLGEVKNGEGVYGLQRSFMVAGSKNLVMSLWKVNDATTQLLMTEFYKNWFRGAPILDAFNMAILEVKSKFEEPYYWGAFVILGN